MSKEVTKDLNFRSNLNSLRDLPDHVIVESYKVVKKFIDNSKVEAVQLFLKESLDQEYSFQSNFKSVILMNDSEFKEQTGYRYSSGVVAIFEKPQFIDEGEVQYPAIILNGLTKVENVGAIVRSSAAFGFKTLIIDQQTCSPFMRRAIRVSMGNIALLKVHRTKDLASFLKRSTANIYAAANKVDSVDFNNWIPNKNSAVIIGSEGHGLENDILEACSDTIRIPILDSVESLNASAAAAIICSKFSSLLNTSK